MAKLLARSFGEIFSSGKTTRGLWMPGDSSGLVLAAFPLAFMRCYIEQTAMVEAVGVWFAAPQN
jgi:hypothetical protein